MIRKPVEDAARYDRVWNEMVLPLEGRVRDERVTMGPDSGCWRP